MGNAIVSNTQISKRQQAKECIQNNQLKEAKLLILDIIENEEEKHKVFIKLGEISTQLNEYKEAEKYYQASISECPENPKSYLKYGNLLHEQLDHQDKAQQMYEKCIKLSCMEVNDECWFNLGKLMFKLNNFHKAIACYAKCKTERACIHYHLAKCLLKTNNIKKAEFALKKATEIQPTVVKYHYEYAKCLTTDLKWFSKANYSFEKAVQLSQYKDIDILNDFIHFLLNDIKDNEKASKYIQIVKDLEIKNNQFPTNKNQEKQDEYKDEFKGENKEEKEANVDEWENIDDFAFREYIRDVCDEFPSDLLNNLDEFMKKMKFLGVNSAKSRSRALNILEKMKRIGNKTQIDDYYSIELAKKIKDGHTVEIFACTQCAVLQESGGIELRNCLHKICYKCFKRKIFKAFQYKQVPFCNTCRFTISCKDIAIHVDENTANRIQNMKSKDQTIFQYERKYSNMVTKSAHHDMCDIGNRFNGNYHISMDEFRGNWENIEDFYNSTMIESFKVKRKSDEWNKVVLHIRNPKHLNIQKIERIQNANLWRKFWNYCIEQKVKNCKDIVVGGFWHGSRSCEPSIIWKGNGFDKNKARVGHCNWFATENTYSMNGWQYIIDTPIHNTGLTNQVFLAFVATGNRSDCKFIRHDRILNVYKNEAAYPAYLITYTNSYNDFDW